MPHGSISWKLVFEYEYAMYEIIMTACTEKEQAEWETRLRREPKDDEDTKRMDPVCFLALHAKSVGPTFGKSGETSGGGIGLAAISC